MSKGENIQPLKTILEAIVPDKSEIKVLRADEIKIQPKNIEYYRLVKKALEEKNTEFHTFRPKQERTYSTVSNISNIKHRVSKQSLSMFFIHLKPNPNNKDIFNCTSLLHTKISFEPPRKKREIAQCTRCQR